MTIILSYIALFIPYRQIPNLVQLWVFLFLAYIVWKQAPLEAKGKPLTTEQKRRLARNSRILILLIIFTCWCWPEGFAINELFYGTVFQVFTLTRPMARAIDGLDQLLDRGHNKFQVFKDIIRKGG